MKMLKKTTIALAAVILLMFGTVMFGNIHAKAADTAQTQEEAVQEEQEEAVAPDSGVNAKAYAAGFSIAIAALGGAIAMGMSISKSNDAIARQPEAEGAIRTLLMLGLVFIETVVIYALIINILIIFVL